MKILFLASIATKRRHFDGERNKSAAIVHALEKKNEVCRCNLSTKWIQPFVMTRFLWKAKFGQFDKIMICKAPTGCSFAMQCLEKLCIDTKKVILYPYGKGLEGIYATDPAVKKRVNRSVFKDAGALIVENRYSECSYESVGCKKIFLLPVVKEVFNLPEAKAFSDQKTLKAIFWARISEAKGVLLAIKAVQAVNKSAGYPKYSLDIAGGDPEPETERRIINEMKSDPNIHYFGTTFTANGIESYQRLQSYDINVFPTFFNHECAPGSIVDMFIAGVPTLSSTFSGYSSMINESNSYLVPQNDLNALIDKLAYVYAHQKDLFDKRALSRAESAKYSYEAFLKFFEEHFCG